MNVNLIYQVKQYPNTGSCLIESRLIIKGSKDNRDKFITFLRSYDIERLFFFIVETTSGISNGVEYVVYEIVIYVQCLEEFKNKLRENVFGENLYFDVLN